MGQVRKLREHVLMRSKTSVRARTSRKPSILRAAAEELGVTTPRTATRRPRKPPPMRAAVKKRRPG